MYKPINGWTKQDIIDNIKKEFKGKGYSSIERKCQYRGDNGTKCAVGMFIPDELYNPQMDDGLNVSTLMLNFPGIESIMPLNLRGLIDIQNIHDKSNRDNCLNTMLSWVEDNVEG